MIELDRMTTEYVAHEDRISITAHVKSGGTARLWLTRRIADRLVAALVKAVQPRHQDKAYVEMIDEIAQQRAEQKHEPQEAVKAVSPDREWLVRKIDVAFPKGGAALIFTGPEPEEPARLIFNIELLRQWLGILRRVYQSGEWAITAWPDSMRNPPSTGHAKVLH